MNCNIISLNELNLKEKGVIKEITCDDNIKRRLLDLGLIEGTNIELVLVSPFKDPKAYEVRGTTIALREEDAKKIYISKKCWNISIFLI